MGFGFSLFGFPVLVVATLGLIFYFLRTRNKKALILLTVMWSAVILLIGVISLWSDHTRPVKLSRKDIIGEYRIDKKMYPGRNANWQNQKYRFTITPTDSICFYVINQGKVQQMFKYQIRYSSGTDLWHIDGTASHHVIARPPVLYRGHERFYYVFPSPLYGNMFFRKAEVSM